MSTRLVGDGPGGAPRAGILAATLMAMVAACSSCRGGCSCAGDADVTVTDAAPASDASAAVPPPTDAGAPDAFGAPSDAGRAADAGPDFLGGECPDFAPSRWAPWTGIATEHACWLFTPLDKESLPARLAWEPCAKRDQFGGDGCRQIAVPKMQALDASQSRVHIGADGRARVALEWKCPRLRSVVWTMAEADGDVLAAIADDTNGWPCRVDRWLTAAGWQAAIGLRTPSSEGFEGEPEKWVHLTGAPGQLAPALGDGKKEEVVSVGEPAGLASYRSDKRSVEMDAALLRPAKAPAWHVKLGSDGRDLVWTMPDPTSDPKGVCDVYTSRWSDDPAALRAVRLRRMRCVDVSGWTVGCGFVATTTSEGKAMLFRLRDGRAWSFPKLCGPLDHDSSCPTRALALGCKEIFLGVGGPAPNLYRVRYERLGPGEAPEAPPTPTWDAEDAGAPDKPDVAE